MPPKVDRPASMCSPSLLSVMAPMSSRLIRLRSIKLVVGSSSQTTMAAFAGLKD